MEVVSCGEGKIGRLRILLVACRPASVAVTLRSTSTCMKLVHPSPTGSPGESTDSRNFGRFNGAALMGPKSALGFGGSLKVREPGGKWPVEG
jgi:hypothetical protein